VNWVVLISVENQPTSVSALRAPASSAAEDSAACGAASPTPLLDAAAAAGSPREGSTVVPLAAVCSAVC
jgi:hypothetical protein